ncbi:hypothetical protein EYF80_049731 [Liparis tanakae]|uniref:Uncharacterized protein n=1 Tax=Liparis tanakae TaxID=230148 RepID=A0A4Z2FGS7_9TELE|nr:hypothetical protein EYF80_049731 [Liparis tanakae]
MAACRPELRLEQEKNEEQQKKKRLARTAHSGQVGCFPALWTSSYLKSLSLEVIFSSRLEMWYEALAMSVPVRETAAEFGLFEWGSRSLSAEGRG